MNKGEYLSALTNELQGLTETERQEALFYYEQYFEDAGIEKEQEVIEELGSPKELAQKILYTIPGVPVPLSKPYHDHCKNSGDTQNSTENRSRKWSQDDTDFHSYTGAESRHTTWKNSWEESQEKSSMKKNKDKDFSSSLLKIILIVALIFITAPLWISVGSVVLSILAVLLLLILLIPSCLTIVALVILAVGVYVFILGFFFPPIFFTSFALWGTGLFLTGLGIVATVGGVMIFVKTFPPLFRVIINIVRLPFHGRNKFKEHV